MAASTLPTSRQSQRGQVAANTSTRNGRGECRCNHRHRPALHGQRRRTVAGPMSAAAVPGLTFIVNQHRRHAGRQQRRRRVRRLEWRCTLRAAITESNWQAGDNRVEFNLPGHRRRCRSSCQPRRHVARSRIASGGLTIDGYTQPGSRSTRRRSARTRFPAWSIRGTADSPRGYSVLHHQRQQHGPRPALQQPLPRDLHRRRRRPRQPDRRQLVRLHSHRRPLPPTQA